MERPELHPLGVSWQALTASKSGPSSSSEPTIAMRVSLGNHTPKGSGKMLQDVKDEADLKTSQSKRYSCPSCPGKLYASKQTLNVHIKKRHGENLTPQGSVPPAKKAKKAKTTSPSPPRGGLAILLIATDIFNNPGNKFSHGEKNCIGKKWCALCAPGKWISHKNFARHMRKHNL